MSAVDPFKQGRKCLHWTRLDPTKPPGLHLPQKKGDVGWDLEALETVVIPPMETRDVPVNAKVELPPDTWALIHNRSSLSRKRNLYVDMNVIDHGYRGPLFVQLRNMNLPGLLHSDSVAYPGAGLFLTSVSWDLETNTTEIKEGECIAQLVFYQIQPVWPQEVSLADFSENTERGVSGFGSTGTQHHNQLA